MTVAQRQDTEADAAAVAASGGALAQPTESLVVPETALSFVPPSVPATATHASATYHSAVPSSAAAREPCVLGVDEAGRGPVVGPMVYAVAYCPVAYKDALAAIGFDDSKVLTHTARSQLMHELCDTYAAHIGWAATTLTARDISAGMLQPDAKGAYNLNEQAHDTTMQLIQETLARGVNVVEVFVDTVGPPASYQAKLQRRFPALQITVAKKADALYPVVSAASICAKVTRDASLQTLDVSGGRWGSGYPSDPKTSAWLKSSVDAVFGWGPAVRFSWQTTRDVLDKHGGAAVQWTDDYLRLFKQTRRERPGFSTAHYGQRVPSDSW